MRGEESVDELENCSSQVSGTSEPRRQRLEDGERNACILAIGGRTEEGTLVTRKLKNRDDRVLAGMSV